MNTLIRFFSKEGQGGQAIVLVALTTLTMLFMVGLAIDTGQLFVARRTMQEAADAGSYAGAVVLYQGGTALQAELAATEDTERNGYVDGGDGGLTTVDINTPPATGPNAGDARYVEVVISTQVRTALVPGQNTLNFVRVRGVAGAEPLNNGYAIMALHRGNTPSAFHTGPNADVHLTGGGILVNSTSSTAAYGQQCTASRFTIEDPFGTDVSGNGSGCFPATGDGLQTGQPQQADPLAGQSPPSAIEIAALPVFNSLPGGNPMVLEPGVYTVEIAAAGNTQIVFKTGVYVLKDGMNGAGNADLVSEPGGVFLYNTTQNYPLAGGTCGSVNLVGNATSDLEAMTTGKYANLLLYQDPACTETAYIAGNGDFNGTGTIYVPNAAFVFDGQNATLTGSQLIALTVDIQNGNVTIDFNAGVTAQPILPRLAE
ncbi:MAG: pilus assembly protein TadG-related protein [Candidatus Limnocylindria bacterium]